MFRIGMILDLVVVLFAACILLAGCSSPYHTAAVDCRNSEPYKMEIHTPGLLFGPIGSLFASENPDSAVNKNQQFYESCMKAKGY
jgi:hypothetical protein